jgi:hypothetical protein
MNTLIQIIGISSLALIFVREWGYKFIKPFSCELCLSFWMGLLWWHSIEGILYAGASAIAATILNRYI